MRYRARQRFLPYSHEPCQLILFICIDYISVSIYVHILVFAVPRKKKKLDDI